MTREFRPGFRTIVASLATVAAIVLAWYNFQQQRKFQPPDDGVTWEDRGRFVVALHVEAGGPAARAGIHDGDALAAINNSKIPNANRVARVLYSAGVWTRTEYALTRDGRPFTASVILEPKPSDHSIRRYLQLVGLLYLGIGLFILVRRPNAPRSRHFYLFCLASFALYFYSYTGKFNNFDWTIYWVNAVAWLLQPPLFLHFSLVFPERKPFLDRRIIGGMVLGRIVLPLIYAPAAVLLLLHVALAIDFLRVMLPSLTVRWMLDRMELAHMGACYLGAAAILYHTYRRADTAILRQQMKWVTRGTTLAILPFTVFYVAPYFWGVIPSPAMNLSVLSLVLIPVTFGYAIFRWRLMDVDILFRRGIAYTLATAALVGVYFTVAALAGAALRTAVPSTGTWGLVIAVVATAFLFEPLRGFIQVRLDRFFYQERYDYRRTLAEFGRELSAEVDLDRMLARALERLSQTLGVEKVAVFLIGEDSEGNAGPGGNMRLERSLGVSYSAVLDLSFLDPERPEFRRGYLFFENVRQAVAETPAAQKAIAGLNLNYYLPCMAQGRTVAFLGLGKTVAGDFLSTEEDITLLETLSGYLGTAIENARLYRRLERKAAQYERLKDFNENIVESVNVGVLALDLEDHIESWNTQVELMYGVSRDRAIGCKIDQVFPPALVAELMRFRTGEDNGGRTGDSGIHNLYKYRVKTSAGQERIFNVAVAPLVSKNFEMVGRLVIFDDITERIELEQQLTQAEKLSSIGLLAAGVAHEVNTPLAVISSYAQMLARQLPEGDPRWKLLDRITRSTFRASEIVNNLLNFSRTGAAEFAGVDVNRVITDTLALLEHQFRSGHITVDRSPVDGEAGEKPAVHGSSGKLQQVFLNLFLNAREAMPEGGTLRVRTEVHNSTVRVEVSDSGHGIARENIHRIYDPFFTTKKAAAAPPGGAGLERTGGDLKGGTGLGLSVTYGIVQEHAGRISVQSAPSRGTTFVLEFPRLVSREAAPDSARELATGN